MGTPCHSQSTADSRESFCSSTSSLSSPLHHKLIRPEDIVMEENRFGQGGFGFVHRGSYQGRVVVCKYFHSRSNDAAVRETYSRELMALELDLKHENIVTLLGATSTLGWEEQACIVMEDAGSETLQSYLQDESQLMTLHHSLFFLCHILDGVGYLHSRNVVHLDLKPANFILNRTDRSGYPAVRLCDFGASHVVGQTWSSQLEGTVAFRAPELFCGGTPAFSSDVYSLGLVMWCFDTRRFPFVEKSHAAIIYQCVENHLRPVVPSGGGPLLQAYRNTYQECWHPLRDERPGLEEVTRRINEITDDMFELESVPLMSHGSFPPAHHSASTCQLSSPPKSSAGDVFHSAHSSVSCLAHNSCQPSPTPPDLCDNTPVFMERAPAAVAGPTVARPADNDRSPSSLRPPSLCRTAGGRHPSPAPLQLCQSVPDLPGLAPATDLLAVPPRRLPSLSVPAAVWTFLIQQLPVLRRAARFLPLLPTSASDH